MRVLHVISTINRGGAENHLADLAIGQASRGLEVKVAFLKGDGYWSTRLHAAGVQTEPLDLAYYGAITPIFRLRRLMSDWGPDLVHAHMPPAELYTRLALLGSGSRPPLVITKHNDEPFYHGPFHRALGRWVARRALRLIVISDAIRSYMRIQMHISDERMRTVHYGIDCRLFENVESQSRRQLRAKWGVAEGDMVIGTIARLVPQKALHILLQAVARYQAMTPTKTRLVVVGHGPLLEDLEKLSDRLGLLDTVLWFGFREDIPALMNAFDVFSLTSVYEGFGLVFLEAMAASRPVVATNVSAVGEIVQNEETGLLCPVDAIEAIAAAFLRMENSELRTRLGRNGHVRARKCFSLERMLDATFAVYRECAP